MGEGQARARVTAPRRNRWNKRRALLAALSGALALLSACAEADTSGTNPSSELVPTAVAIVRSIATVDLPPTLSRVEKQQTRQAVPVTATQSPPTATPTETPYIGVFLGAAQIEVDLPRVDVAATSLPEPTAEGDVACEIEIDPVFGTAWRENPSVARRVGCALQERFGFAADVQVFENGGVMYQRRESGEVWAIQPGQVRAGRFWFTNLPLVPAPIAILPPEGLRPPSDAFLGLWTSDQTLQQTLGYARTPQQTADLNIQRVEGGTLILDVTITQVFLLLDNGDAFGPY